LIILQAIDPNKNHLAICDIDGHLFTIDLDSGKIMKNLTLPLDETSLVWSLEFDPESGALFALQSNRLSKLNPTTLELIAFDEFLEMASGLLIDSTRNRILLAFPSRLQVGVYSMDDLSKTGTLPALAGVRNMVLDESKNLVIMGSISGAVEVRDADSFLLISRNRLMPWIHGLEAIPQTGQVFVTTAAIKPAFWQYDPPEGGTNPADSILYFVETLGRLTLDRISISESQGDNR
jgi:hypothetical protein